MSGERAAGTDVAVATVTLVRDPTEEMRLRSALTVLTGHGWPVFTSDGGSGGDFLTFLRRLPGVTVAAPAGPGMVGQARASLTAAARAGSRFVLYSEPDKQHFFESHLHAFIHRGRALDADLALAARSDDAFRTYPPTQQSTERAINQLCGEFVGLPGDYSYGPFLLRSELASHIERIEGNLGWGWRPFLFATVHRLGHRLAQVVADLECPADQRVEDERERLHRLRQVVENMNGLLAGLTMDLTR